MNSIDDIIAKDPEKTQEVEFDDDFDDEPETGGCLRQILSNPEVLTPQLLFELYTYNYQRTLFEKLLNDKIDDAERVVDDLKKIKRREDDVKFNFYDENHEFEPTRSENEPDLRYFIELLNILDQELLADVSMVKIRRNWKPNEPIQAEFINRELLTWASLFNRFDLIDEILNDKEFQEYVKNNTKLLKSDPKADMSIDGQWDSFSESATLNAPLTLHTGIAQFLGVAFLLSNLRKICGKYITLVELKKQYQDKFDEMQSNAVQILDQCYKENYDMCLLLIRWKHVLWGYRTPLELGDLGHCEDFMAHQAVQDLLDKVWFGGVEPFASLFKKLICSLLPFLAPFLLTASQDKMIDRIGFFKSGMCYGCGTEEPSPEPSPDNPPSKFSIMVYWFLSPVNCFIIDCASYFAFLVLFAWVILTKFCIEITFFEYILLIWLISIQIERMKKFAAMANKPRAEKIKLLKKDKWNAVYLLAFLTCLAGLILRVASVMQSDDVFYKNVAAFQNTQRPIYIDIDYTSDDRVYVNNKTGNPNSAWNTFKDEQKYSSIHAFIDTANSPIYNAFDNETENWINRENNGIWPKEFISVQPGTTSFINYCPQHILSNGNFEDPKFLKWAQIFYGITFVLMSLGILHFYDVDHLLGPLSISIGRMLKDLASFIFILVVFLIPYGIVTTALLYPNELRFSECLEGIFFKPMLTLYGEMFLSEYTLYDLNDELDCASTENVIEIQTTNPDYSGFSFVEKSDLFQNFTHNWEMHTKPEYDIEQKPLREWDACSPGLWHAIQFASFYMVNYNCYFSKLPDQVHEWYRDDAYDGTESNLKEMYCLFQNNWHLNDQTLETVIKERDTWTVEEVQVWPISKLFEKECFSKLGIIRIPKAFKEMDDVQYKYKPFNIEYATNGQTRNKRSDNSNNPKIVELWLENANDDVNRTAAERQKFITDEKEKDYAAKKTLMNMLEKDKALRFEDVMQDEKDGKQPSWYYIYSTDDIDQEIFKNHNFNRLVGNDDFFLHRRENVEVKDIEENNTAESSRKRRDYQSINENLFYHKNLQMRFNSSISNCWNGACGLLISRSKGEMVAAVITYAHDKRRFNLIKTSLVYDGYDGTFLDLYKHNDLAQLSAPEIVKEFFHDTDIDYMAWTETNTADDGTKVNEWQWARQSHGIIDEPGLLLFFKKKFIRCPESYFVTTLMLSIYLMVATVMVLNLLVALFATTYEDVMEKSENIWKLNRYDLVLEYWGKTPLSCTPFMILEHILTLFRMCIFHSKGPARQNQIVCWARSPGDHALHVTQFPIIGVNYFPPEEFSNDEDAKNFNTVIEDLIEWEKERIVEADEEAEDNQDPEEKLKHIEHVTLNLEDDIRALTFQIVKE